jgi:phosphoribosylformylglycinamidine cyclo-ligase
MAGTIVGVVDKAKILNGSRVAIGDVLIGLPSNGLHTNGYSLARAALFPKYTVHDHLPELGCTVGEALLRVHRSYLHIVAPLLDNDLVNGLSHITGGGLVGNTSRILAEGQALQVNWGTWSMPPIFSVIQQAGNISDEEMRHVFNLGVGMVLVVSPDRVDDVMRACEAEHPFVVGSVVSAH